MKKHTILEEVDLTDRNYRMVYGKDEQGQQIIELQMPMKESSLSYLFRSMVQIFQETFLPSGYPQSVRPEYLEYQLWDAIQGLCSYLRSVITAKAIFAGIGVGNSAVTPLAAALAWVMKDGMGMIGSLSLAYYCTDSFEAYTKEWRLLADILNNIGLLSDLLCATVSPQQAQYLLILSSVSKSCCGLIAGATKARISAHFAKKGHLADVNAKESTQETAIALIGLLLGMGLAKGVGNDDISIWTWFLIFLIVHMYSNYRLIKVLVFENINPQRIYLITKFAKDNPNSVANIISSPVTLTSYETLSCPLYLWWFGPRFGCSLQELSSSSQLEQCIERLKDQKFVVGLNAAQRICICLQDGISEEDVVKAYFIGCFVHLHSLNVMAWERKVQRVESLQTLAVDWYKQVYHILASSSSWELNSSSALVVGKRRFRLLTESKKAQ